MPTDMGHIVLLMYYIVFHIVLLMYYIYYHIVLLMYYIVLLHCITTLYY